MVDPVGGPFEAAESSAAALAAVTGVDRHDVAIVLGSGWRPAVGPLGEVVAEVELPELGGFPPAGVAGHRATALSIRTGDRRILVFLGRVHAYEGHHPNTVVHGVRTAVRTGCKVVVLTNAAGGLRLGLSTGDPVLIRDHVNLTGLTPLLGVNDDRLGPRFPDMTHAYSERLRTV